MGIAFLASASVCAQSALEPKILEEFYALKISPNGRWIYSNPSNGEIVIYDLETNDHNEFYEVSLGNGNVIANDGTCVGSKDTGKAIIIKGDKMITPTKISTYWYSNINGISIDASKIVGVVGNPRSSGTDDEINQIYLPFVADIDEDGKVGEMTFLPHPSKDFFGMVPQYSSATWISDDCRTILGQTIDYSGMFIQPIVYHQDASGEWSYTLPTESMFNPDHINLPEYPGEFDYGLMPNPLDYMTPEKQEEYEEDLEYWRNHYDDPDVAFPDDHLEDYMTEEKLNAYYEALDNFYIEAEKYNDEILEYILARNEIIDTSVSFVQNASAMNGEGTFAVLTSSHYVETGEEIPESYYGVYTLDVEKGTIAKIDTQYKDLISGQVLDRNVILSSTPASEYPAAYVYEAGASDFVPVQDYLSQFNPSAVEWMEDNLVHELAGTDSGISPYSTESGTRADVRTALISGFGVASRDFSVFAGAVPAYMYDPVLYYMTYIFTDITTSGIGSVAIGDSSAVKVVNNGVLAIDGAVDNLAVVDLSGRKVFGMQKAEGTVDTKLNRGIYIVSYIGADGQRVSKKVNF